MFIVIIVSISHADNKSVGHKEIIPLYNFVFILFVKLLPKINLLNDYGFTPKLILFDRLFSIQQK
jgi:hypothetical protein